MRQFILTFLCFFIGYLLKAQEVQLSGYIKSIESGEIISDAVVYVDNGERNTISNEYGYFNFQVPTTARTLHVSYIGYKEYSLALFLAKDTLIKVELEGFQLQTVEVVATKNVVVHSPSILNVPVADLQKIPNIGGESDILKSLAIYPGVTLGAEGSANLYVRGGTPDQNLILLDGIPVYNAAHLGGYLSVFNTDALRSVKLIKGNFPAQHGGRLSSILDIKIKEGNKKELKTNIGLGILTSRFLIEGPIKKDQSSFIFTARSSYLGLINTLRKKEESENYFDYWLYDINAKVNFDLKKGDLFFSYYSGNDSGVIKDSGGSSAGGVFLEKHSNEDNIKWGNTTFSTRYSLPLSKKIFLKAIVGYTQYRYNFKSNSKEEIFGTAENKVTETEVNSASKLQSLIADIRFDYSPFPNHKLNFGVNIDQQFFKLSNHIDSVSSTNGRLLAAYIQDDYYLNSALTLNMGLRFSLFHADNNNYYAAEPRFGINYEISKNVSISSSYTQMVQYLHLLNSTSFGFPNDIWVSANSFAPPEKSKQLSIGLTTNIKQHIFQVDAFYKKMSQLIEYRTGRNDFLINLNDLAKDIEIGGEGKVYGLEFYQKSTFAKLTSTIGYTLSWNHRKFDNINNGEKFPFLYDRRHDFSLLLNYNFNKKWWLSVLWIYQTGRKLTLPTALIPDVNLNGTGQGIYPNRNNGSLPAYHRMDISFNHEKTTKKGNTFGWNISIYNLYNRANPSYLFIRSTAVFDELGAFAGTKKNVRLVALFPIIPSFSVYYKI